MNIGYARVSKADQNLDLQINALRKAGCELIYQEKMCSVKTKPELEKLLSYMRKGDVVIVWKLDRIGRSLRHLLKLIETFKQKEVDFISITDGINTSTALGKLVLHINGAYAEFEREICIERTNEGLQAAKERGVQLGRRKGLGAKGEATAKAACNLYMMREMGTVDICRSLNISSATLYRYLEAKGVTKRNNPGRKKKQD